VTGRPIGSPGFQVAALVVLLALAVARARRSDRATAASRRLRGPVVPLAAVPSWFTAALARLDLQVDPVEAWRLASIATGAVAVVAVGSHPAAILAAGPMAAVLLVVVVLAVAVGRRHRRAVQPGVDAGAVVELLVAPLGSGATLGQAVARAAASAGPADPVGLALGDLRRAVDDGSAVQDAFDRWARAEEDGGLRLVADALAVAGVTGGSRVGALLGVGETLRERDALAREIRALGSQARTSAAVLAATPLAFTAAVALADRRVASFLLGTPPGWGCLVLGVAAEAVGWWWMQRLLGAVA
jgi:tight adherence protein B